MPTTTTTAAGEPLRTPARFALPSRVPLRARSAPATRSLDLDGAFELSRDPAQGGFRVEDGRLLPLDAPGLGIEMEVP